MYKFNFLHKLSFSCVCIIIFSFGSCQEKSERLDDIIYPENSTIKKIERIVRRNESVISHEYNFQYNKQGQVSEIRTYGHDSYENEINCTTFTYTDDHVTAEVHGISGVEDPYTYTYTVVIYLDENGLATKSDTSYGNSYIYSYNTDGYLSTIIEKFNLYENYLTVTNGNLTKVNHGENWVSEFTYTNILNNANIDLFYFVCYIDLCSDLEALYLGLTGKRFERLPSSITNSDSKEDEPYQLSYTVDDKMYVTCITTHFVDYSISYDIYYEE